MHRSIRNTVLLVGACVMAGTAAWSQQQSKKLTPPPPVSADVAATFAVERAQLVPGECCVWLKGGGVDAAVSFWKGLGLAAALNGDHISNATPDVDVNKISYLAGPRYTFTAWQGHASAADQRRLQVYAQALFGGTHGFDGLYPATGSATSSANSLAVETGGGLNFYLTKHWGVRLIEADYVRTELPNASTNAQNDLRLAFGVTYHLQGAPTPIVTLAAAASPAVVYAGDPVAVTATAGHLNPKLHTVYSWSGNGVTGTTARATVATSGLKPGRYTVKAEVKEGKAGKEGLKPWEAAEATASFTVKQFEPPTVSLAASPNSVKPGETSAIAATGVSPQNRPLTYSYTASAGTVTGAGATASFSSIGAATGPVTITGTVTDDKGQTATATTEVTIVAPIPAPPPHVQALSPIGFSKDKARPTRVDNEAKAILDGIALDLGKQPDAKLEIVGEADAKERAAQARQEKAAAKNKRLKVVDLAAERAVNAKDYLVTEKGIDAGRIGVATGTTDSQTAENYLIPAGANFTADVTGTTPVDEGKVKAQTRKPLGAKKHKKA